MPKVELYRVFRRGAGNYSKGVNLPPAFPVGPGGYVAFEPIGDGTYLVRQARREELERAGKVVVVKRALQRGRDVVG